MWMATGRSGFVTVVVKKRCPFMWSERERAAGFSNVKSTAYVTLELVGSQWGWRLVSTMSWWRLGGLQKVTEGGFDEEVLG